MNVPQRFDDVSVICKANVYFDGKVVSHTVLFKDGTKRTVGLIYPGSFKFDTDDPERMEITVGHCRVRQAGEDQWESYAIGEFFFEISVSEGILEYVCSFED
jgi:uncharacterized protein YaiE (UPF0345 family)